MKSSTEKVILLLMAIGLTLLPAFPDAVEDLDSLADVDPCGTFPADPCDAGACESEPDPGDNDCCKTGCQHCSLPCCSGTVMIATVIQVLDAVLTADGHLASIATEVAWVDADPLYHPPRA